MFLCIYLYCKIIKTLLLGELKSRNFTVQAMRTVMPHSSILL